MSWKKKILSVPLMTIVLLITMGAGLVSAVDATPSTNDINITNNWAHFNVLSVGVGEAEIELVQPRGFWACFEYRTDGDTSQMIDPNNYNSLIGDGLYPYVCLNGDSTTITVNATEYIEIRMVFGAESDERFDWTRVDVLPAETKKSAVWTGRWVHTYPGNWWCNLVSFDKKPSRFSDPDYVDDTCGVHSIYGDWNGGVDYKVYKEMKMPNGDLKAGNRYFVPAGQ